jgi:asparagine synthetase B (glutamine-hydrolysing)
MCGICGSIGFDSKESGEAIVRRMFAAIVHRGPDREGILGHRGFCGNLGRLMMRGLRLNGDAYTNGIATKEDVAKIAVDLINGEILPAFTSVLGRSNRMRWSSTHLLRFFLLRQTWIA